MAPFTKWAFISFAILSIILTILIEGMYYNELYDLDLSKPAIAATFTETYRKVLWASLEETSEVKIESATAFEYAIAFLQTVITDDYMKKEIFYPAGAKTADMTGRYLSQNKPGVKSTGTVHFSTLVAGIWVSNNFSTDEALDYLLSVIYFGKGIYGILDGARYYYGKPSSELTSSEIVTLMVISQNPAWLDPFCNRENLEKRSRALYKKGSRLWSKEFPINDYTFPAFTSMKDRKCK